MAQDNKADAERGRAPRKQTPNETAEIGRYRLDEDGNVVTLDRALFRLLDLQHSCASPDDCVGQPFEGLAAPGSLRRLRSIQASQEGTLLGHDYPVLTRIGNRKWTRHYSCRVEDADHGRDHVEGTVLNVTGARERRARLGRDLSVFEQYISTTVGGMWEVEFPCADSSDPGARRIYLSPRCKSFLGYGPTEFPDSIDAWQERIHPGDLEQLRASARRHMEGASDLHEVEYRIRHRDGSQRWIHTRARIHRDPDGTPRCWQGIDWDITELRRRREEADGSDETGLDRLLDSLRRGVVEVDTAGRITYVNSTLCAMLGHERRELMFQRTVEFCPTAEERSRMQDYLRSLVGDRPPSTPYVTRLRCKDGSIRELEVEWDYRTDAGGKLLGFVGVVTDITERANTEHALMRRARLEASATLAAGMAHRFNNLMVCVLGNTEILQGHYDDDSDGATLLASISEAARDATDLVGQLLSFSRQGSRRSVPVDINALLEAQLNRERPRRAQGIKLKFIAGGDLGPVFADDDQVVRALTAVCRNAFEAVGSAGHVRIETLSVSEEVEGCDRPLGWVRVVVEDDGEGMRPETRERVFEPFFTTKFQGRGLGLSAAYGIVQTHGGRISIRSERGRGTTVHIDLPVREEETLAGNHN